MSVHDGITRDLEKHIKNYDEKGSNTEYGNGRCIVGEIDFYFYRDRVLHLFETKCTYNNKNYEKAAGQLLRAIKNTNIKFHKYMGYEPRRIRSYFVSKNKKKDKLIVKYLGGIKL